MFSFFFFFLLPCDLHNIGKGKEIGPVHAMFLCLILMFITRNDWINIAVADYN